MYYNYLIATWLGVEPTTSRLQVLRPHRYSTKPLPRSLNIKLLEIRKVCWLSFICCHSLLLQSLLAVYCTPMTQGSFKLRLQRVLDNAVMCQFVRRIFLAV